MDDYDSPLENQRGFEIRSWDFSLRADIETSERFWEEPPLFCKNAWFIFDRKTYWRSDFRFRDIKENSLENMKKIIRNILHLFLTSSEVAGQF